jgi:tRNA 2-thiouridine synthesizing protein A
MTRHTLDARRLLCPLPVLKMQNCLKTLDPGDILEVLATDKGVLFDIPAYCRQHGLTVLQIHELEKEIHFEIQK